MPRERGLDAGDRHPLDIADKILQVTDGQAVEPDDGEILVDLAVAVDAHRETADDVLPGRPQFLFGRSIADKVAQGLAHHGQRFVGLVAPRLHADHERTARQRR